MDHNSQQQNTLEFLDTSRSALQWFHKRRIMFGIQQTSEHLTALRIDPRTEIDATEGVHVKDTELLLSCGSVLKDYG